MGFDSRGKFCKVPGYRSKNEVVQISNQKLVFCIIQFLCFVYPFLCKGRQRRQVVVTLLKFKSHFSTNEK